MGRKEFREYLKRKESEEKELERKKAIIKDSYLNNKLVPFHLRSEARELMDEIIYETGQQRVSKPLNVYVTTSRDPSSRLKQFAKHLSLILNASSVTRGSMTIKELAEQNFDVLVMVGESHGQANSLILTYFPYGPTFYFSLHNVRLLSRTKPFSTKALLILENFGTDIGLKLKQNLSYMFPSVEKGKRVVVFHNKDDIIRFRHYFLEHNPEEDTIRFDMKLYKVMKGSLEFEGDPEWELRAFINTANKNNVL